MEPCDDAAQADAGEAVEMQARVAQLLHDTEVREGSRAATREHQSERAPGESPRECTGRLEQLGDTRPDMCLTRLERCDNVVRQTASGHKQLASP